MNQDIGNSYSSKDTKTKLSITYNKIRSKKKLLAKKLTLDDQCVQSMANTSPKKSHLAHTREPNQVYLPKFLLPSGPLAVHRVEICKRRWNVDQETS